MQKQTRIHRAKPVSKAAGEAKFGKGTGTNTIKPLCSRGPPLSSKAGRTQIKQTG